MDFHASAISLREAMEKMNGTLPALPGGARRRVLVPALRLAEAAGVLRAVAMRATTWRLHNLTAVTQMASAYVLMGILLAAFPARVENPHDYAGNLAWIRDCEVQLRQCAIDVGGSFSVEAIPLCDGMLHHVNASAHQSLKWIVRDAKALLKRVTKLHKSAHTLNQAADDPCEAAAGHDLETKAFS